MTPWITTNNNISYTTGNVTIGSNSGGRSILEIKPDSSAAYSPVYYLGYQTMNNSVSPAGALEYFGSYVGNTAVYSASNAFTLSVDEYATLQNISLPGGVQAQTINNYSHPLCSNDSTSILFANWYLPSNYCRGLALSYSPTASHSTSTTRLLFSDTVNSATYTTGYMPPNGNNIYVLRYNESTGSYSVLVINGFKNKFSNWTSQITAVATVSDYTTILTGTTITNTTNGRIFIYVSDDETRMSIHIGDYTSGSGILFQYTLVNQSVITTYDTRFPEVQAGIGLTSYTCSADLKYQYAILQNTGGYYCSHDYGQTFYFVSFMYSNGSTFSKVAQTIKCNRVGNIIFITTSDTTATFFSNDYGITNKPLNYTSPYNTSAYNAKGLIFRDDGSAFYTIGSSIVRTSINSNAPTCLIQGGLSVDSMLATKYSIVSDIRVKKNISQVDNISDMIRQIGIKQYEYIDDDFSETTPGKPVYGVIAQDIETILREAITMKTEYIPNIMRNYSILTSHGENIYTIISSNEDTGIPPISLPVSIKIKSRGECSYGLILEKYPDHSLKIFSKNIFPGESFFICGSQIHNFRLVDKSKLAMIALAGISDLSAKMSALYSKINDMITVIKK